MNDRRYVAVACPIAMQASMQLRATCPARCTRAVRASAAPRSASTRPSFSLRVRASAEPPGKARCRERSSPVVPLRSRVLIAQSTLSGLDSGASACLYLAVTPTACCCNQLTLNAVLPPSESAAPTADAAAPPKPAGMSPEQRKKLREEYIGTRLAGH